VVLIEFGGRGRPAAFFQGLKDAEADAGADFGFDDHDSAVVDLGSWNDNNISNNNVAISDIDTKLR
jgi:hypothetical protein